MMPQDFQACNALPQHAVEPDARGLYQYQFMPPGVRPAPHNGLVNSQQWMPVPAPMSQVAAASMPAIQMLPVNTAVVCAPMTDISLSDPALHLQAGLGSLRRSQAVLRSGGGSMQPPQQRAMGYNRMWSEVPGYTSRPGQGMGAAVGQATSVEDILQLLRSMPRGTPAIPVVADSLRYLDSRALAALLKELSKTGLRELAFEIFDWLRNLNEQLHPEYMGLLDVFTYTTMIAQCTNHMHLPIAMELVSEMRSRNIGLNTHTYSSLLNVCVKVGELELALDVFNKMLAEGLAPNLVTYNTLLEVYAKRGMWAEAVGVLDTLEQQRLVPEPRTYNIVMNACNAAGQFASCISVHVRMSRQKVPPTVGTYNAVILAHCKLDQLSAAQQLFGEMQQQGCQPTHTTFITLLQAAEAHAQAAVAVSLLEKMQGLALRLTPQCYAAAIGACAAAGQLATARKLLADMLASSKAGMAAPAHIIMQLQDKCCDWQGAHRTYQKLLASGVRPDSQTTGTAIEALWGAGNVSSCLLALQVFEGACKQGVFRLTVNVRSAESAVGFSLPVSGTCMALISLWRLLAELRGRVSRDGPGILRSSVVVLLGDGQAVLPQLQVAMAQLCAVPGMPFVVDAASNTQVTLVAPANELGQWLLSEQSLLLCPLMPAAAELVDLPEQQLLEAEGLAVARCRQRLLQALDSEKALVQGSNSLPLHYQQARSRLWQQLQAACVKLQPHLLQLPYDALALLDQAAAAGLLQPPPDTSQQDAGACGSQLPREWLLAACVSVAGQAAMVNGAVNGGVVGGSAAPEEDAIARHFGVEMQELVAAACRLREGCGPACQAPVSAHTLLDIFREALCAGQLSRKVPVSSLLGDVAALLAHAVSSPRSLGLPASQLASLVVIAGRQARGLYPAWPKVLVVLTGAMHPVAEGQQELLRELMWQADGGSPAAQTAQ